MINRREEFVDGVLLLFGRVWNEIGGFRRRVGILKYDNLIFNSFFGV